jgi:hypothetical protein
VLEERLLMRFISISRTPADCISLVLSDALFS